MRSDILLFSGGMAAEAMMHGAIANRSIHLQTARSVDEARLCLEKNCVDILVCDDEKSGIAWLDLVVHAARRYASIVSIVTAHFPSVEVMIRAVNDGRVFAFLPKPLDCTILRRSIDEALSRSAASFAMRRALEVNSPAEPPLQPVPVRVVSSPERGPGPVAFGQPFTGLPGDLSLREWEVLALLTDGLTTRQIAKRLFISVYTVRNHLKSMYRKLEVHSQSELIDWYQTYHPQRQDRAMSSPLAS